MYSAMTSFVYRNLIEAPSYHLYVEALLILWVFWLLRKKKQSEINKKLSVEEEEQIINAWKPRPLVDLEKEKDEQLWPEDDDNSHIWGQITSRPGKYLEVDGEKYLNMATHNYLGLVDNEELDDAAEACIRRYGVGSCGPRGFYGTVDVHIKLEEKIAEFLNLEETALYSYGFAAVSSAIPSYAKAGDIIFADELVNFAIQRGLQASRSNIVYFKHNKWEDLQQKLEAQKKLDRKNPKKASKTRRFCVVEGIYSKTGEMCPLNEIVDLCKEHKVRLFVDETISFGVIGKTGRGITEHLGVSVKDIDFISGSLEHGLASFGGFIVGPSFVVDHQRISGLGYCFSASLPPLLAGAGIKALDILEENPSIIDELQDKCKYIQRSVEKDLSVFFVTCDELSPIKFLYIANSHLLPRDVTKKLLDDVIIYVKENHKIALIQPNLLGKEHIAPVPSIRITVNRLLTYEEIDRVMQAIEDATVSLGIFDTLLSYIEDKDTIKQMLEYRDSLNKGEPVKKKDADSDISKDKATTKKNEEIESKDKEL